MPKSYSTKQQVWYFNQKAQLASDNEILPQITEIAAAFDALGTYWITNGISWLDLSDGTPLAYYTIGITQGAHTTLTITDAGGNVYTKGMRVLSGATLTITAAATTGYTLSTYTVNTVDKKSSNPTTHVVAADVAIVTAATAS